MTNLRLVVLFSPQESEESPEVKPLAQWRKEQGAGEMGEPGVKCYRSLSHQP